VYLSAFDLFRIGPGPSSSATVGPQRAALRFVHDLAADGLVSSAAHVEAEARRRLSFAHASGRRTAPSPGLAAIARTL
jgi:L-serine dehydratase